PAPRKSHRRAGRGSRAPWRKVRRTSRAPTGRSDDSGSGRASRAPPAGIGRGKFLTSAGSCCFCAESKVSIEARSKEPFLRVIVVVAYFIGSLLSKFDRTCSRFFCSWLYLLKIALAVALP